MFHTIDFGWPRHVKRVQVRTDVKPVLRKTAKQSSVSEAARQI